MLDGYVKDIFQPSLSAILLSTGKTATETHSQRLTLNQLICVHLGKSPMSNSIAEHIVNSIRIGRWISMRKKGEGKGSSPSWDLPWGGLRTVPRTCAYRVLWWTTVVSQGKQLSSCPKFFADMATGYWGGNDIAWDTQCLQSKPNTNAS